MKKILRPFLIALAVVFSLHLASLIFLTAINEFDLEDFKRALPISIPLFFIPPFLSYLFFNKEEKNNLFKAPLFSFVLLYVFIFLYYQFIKTSREFSFFEYVSIGNAILASFVALFFNFIQKIKQKSLNIKNRLIFTVKYSIKYCVLIPVFGLVIYSILTFIFSSSNHNTLYLWGSFLPVGILISIVSIEFFKYTYKNFTNRLFYLIGYYFVAILFFGFVSFIPSFITTSYLGNTLLYKSLMPFYVIFTPYFLFIITLTHLYFLRIVNKQEKQFLKQESLASQLNYQQLKNQLSPHFLFNNINVLTSLIEENPEKAVSFSEKLSNIYRYFLEQEKQDVVLLKVEINFAKDYLHLLKSRFENGFNFSFDVNQNSEKYIVSTTLQQVLENVVKHNEVSLNNPIEILISTKDDYLKITNNKNKKVILETTSKKGIENIKKRYSFFTDKSIIVEEDSNNFTINLPLLEK